jgi:hypothetical protein
MSYEACRAAVSHNVDPEIAGELHAACEPICGCEQFRLSDYSPGQVGDEETLNLIIIDPQGIQGGKIPHPGALVQIDRSGLSVLRDRSINEEFEITINELRARAKANGVERFFHGVCSFRASAIRFDGEGRFLCVYDTALQEKPSHADVFGPDLKAMASPEVISNGEHERRKRARIKKLIDKIGDCFAPASTFRNGVFAGYSRSK